MSSISQARAPRSDELEEIPEEKTPVDDLLLERGFDELEPPTAMIVREGHTKVFTTLSPTKDDFLYPASEELTICFTAAKNLDHINLLKWVIILRERYRGYWKKYGDQLEARFLEAFKKGKLPNVTSP